MEIGPDKMKVMTNNTYGFQNRKIKIKDQRLESVESTWDQSSLMKEQNLRFFQDSPDNSSF